MLIFDEMSIKLPIKKLLRVAAFTSTAIGIITVGPAFVVVITLIDFDFNIKILSQLLFASITGISLFVFLIWCINLLILNFLNNRTILHQIKKFRYLSSYLVSLFLMFSVRMMLNPLFNNPEKVRQILSWKMAYFGLQPGSIDFMRFNNLSFQLLTLVFVVISINTVVLILQEMVLLLERKTIIETENIGLKMKNMEAANEKLKQQLQPHFLFNSLNVLKTLIKKQPDNAEAYLKRLSDFLRASVTFDQVNVVKFSEELKLSLDYIEMQKIRFGNALQYINELPEEPIHGTMPLFSIQLLLENAIKHNAFTEERPLTIHLSYNDGWIEVKNNKQQKQTNEPSTGKGFYNLSERYKLISGDDIHIQSLDNEFIVKLKILPNENCNN